MTDKKPENPQAFPRPRTEVDEDKEFNYGQPGMTLLDWYAGKALVGDMSAFTKELDHCYDPDMVAVRCFDYAEAMLAERQKRMERGK